MVHLKLNHITGILLVIIATVLIFGLIIFPMNQKVMTDENGAGTGGIAVCIDGIYFGVCTGDSHFDSGESCFGLTTQQCFDKCNVIGNTCRVE